MTGKQTYMGISLGVLLIVAWFALSLTAKSFLGVRLRSSILGWPN